MKEEDLDKCLDNLIIDGLIKEARQDDADFFAAMKKISYCDFMDIVRDPVACEEDMSMLSSPITHSMSTCEQESPCEYSIAMSDDYDAGVSIPPKIIKSNWLQRLESDYEECIIERDGRTYYDLDGIKKAGMKLAKAYLRRKNKEKAQSVLETLTTIFAGSPFGLQCMQMLKSI